MCIVDRSGHTTMVTIDMEETTVKAHAAFDEIRVYREFTDDPIREVADALKDRGLAGGAVGVEMEYLPAGDFATLRDLLPEGGSRCGGRDLSGDPSGQDRQGDRSPALPEPHHGPGHRRNPGARASGHDRAGDGGRAHRADLLRRRAALQAHDHRLRRAEPVPQRGPHRPGAPRGGPDPHGDLRRRGRVPRRGVPHRGGGLRPPRSRRVSGTT